uniref:Acid ceramidase n=1 Tax=Panagrellus redivivus TaxID=6233 RepID=A0A7E4V4J4_PANRE
MQRYGCLLVAAVILGSFIGPGNSVYVPLPARFADHCIIDDGVDLYKPELQYQIPWFTVNLDDDPYVRFQEIATIYKANIKDLIQVIKDLILPIIPDGLQIVHSFFGGIEQLLPNPYRDEIRGIADAAEMDVSEVVLYNIFYEIFTVCTSIIAQDATGHIYHARNLDFGLFLGWNATTHDWLISQHLRKMVVNINWVRNGKIVFVSNNFAGFVGIYNGMKKGAFTVTANERFDALGGYVGIIRWLVGLEPEGRWMTWLTRETLEQKNTYAEALEHLSNTEMLSPVYYILTLNGTIQNQTISMHEDDPYGWYLLQTNYDPNDEVLFLDDRRTPGHSCMRKLGKENVGFAGIFNVLSSKTNLNKLTTYTVLMDTNEGKFETILQECPGDCWGW